MTKIKKNMEQPVLSMQSICKSFSSVKALDGVDLELNAGEVHILVGENGAGKSTLMKILSGAYSRDSGEIFLSGSKTDITSPARARELGIGIIYQEFNLVPYLSVAANIFLGQELITKWGGLDRQDMLKETKQLLNELGMALDPGMPVGQLSVADQQMVEIARALRMNSKILIMDEPTSALSKNEIRTLFNMIAEIKQRGVGIIYISHRMEELFEIGNCVTILRDGKTVGNFPIAEIDRQNLIRLMADRELTEFYPRKDHRTPNCVLEVDNVSTKDFLHDISFKLFRGEILGIAGLVGAGRTELARVLFGADRQQSGTIHLNNKEVKIKSPGDAIRAGIGLLTEDRKTQGLVMQLSVNNNIALPNLDLFARSGFLLAGDERENAERFVSELRIKTPSVDQKAIYLSGGNQQKVVLAKWLSRHLDVLIFDEPTRGIDVASKVELYEIMNALTEKGVGIIMISSDLPEILGMSDRVLVMRDGQIAAEFEGTEIDQEMILTSALGEAV